MKIRYQAISDVGRVRSNNEDMALVFGAFVRDDEQSSMVPMQSRPRFTALVADGMGGYGGGEIASAMVLASFDEFPGSLPEGMSVRETMQAVRDWLRRVQQAVLDKAATDRELANMGTTLTGIFTYGPYEFMVNAGDSRVYRRRYDTLRRLSTDHSERERTGNPLVPSNLIYNAVGVPGAFIDVTCLTNDMPMIDGDVYVICSDGLCDMIDDDAIDAILASGGGARELVDAALEAGGRDNCTVIVLYVSMPADEPTAETEKEQEKEPDKEPAAEVSTDEDAAPAVPNDIPAQGGFEIDEPEPDPVPPTFNGFGETPVGPTVTVVAEEVTETRADSGAAQGPAERARQAAGLVKEALHILFGNKKK